MNKSNKKKERKKCKSRNQNRKQNAEKKYETKCLYFEKNQENNTSEANYLRNKWDITEINIRIRGEYITTNPTNITEMAIEY